MHFVLLKILLLSIIVYIVNTQSIADCNNKFAFQLYNKISKNDENLIYSPYSIFSSLTMCLLGSQNQTEAQLRNLLNYNNMMSNFSVNEANAQLFNYLNQFKDSNITLNIANKIYPKQGIEIKKEFLTELELVFNSHIHLIDYSNPSFAISLINSWVNSQTNDKIKSLLSQDSIDENTAMILINAIYFKGNWLNKFDKNETKKEKFYLDDGTIKDVDMMHLSSGYFKLRQNPSLLNITVCEFPYIGRSLSMSIILPNENVKLSEIEKSLDYNKLKSIFEIQAHRSKVEVFLPKFKFEQQLELSKLLSSMGAIDAFDADKANFKNMSDSTDLYIAKVIHKAVIEVSEEGTEAAAATAIINNNRNSIIDYPLDLTVFKCNKPFLFVIHENQNNTILFVGKYVK